jgi:hypothetical protein
MCFTARCGCPGFAASSESHSEMGDPVADFHNKVLVFGQDYRLRKRMCVPRECFFANAAVATSVVTGSGTYTSNAAWVAGPSRIYFVSRQKQFCADSQSLLAVRFLPSYTAAVISL